MSQNDIPPDELEKMRKYADRMRIFIPNRQAFPQEELAKYEEKWVAFSPDGTRIVASSGESMQAVYDQIVAAGFDPSEYIFDFIPDADKTHLGGIMM